MIMLIVLNIDHQSLILLMMIFYLFFFLNNISGWHTARVPQDGLLFILTKNLIMVQNNNVHFILTKTYRSIFTLDEKEINIENYCYLITITDPTDDL